MSIKYIAKHPTLCMVVGVPASGKTLLAKELTKTLGNAAYISKDFIQSIFTEERVTGQMYATLRGPTLKVLLDFADMNLGFEKIPIIDAPFSINHWRQDEYREWIPPFRAVAEKHNARLAIIRCLPPSLDELKRRIKERKYKWDNWKLENWSEFLIREPINFPIDHDDVYEVVTDKSVEILVKDVLKYLKASSI